MSHINSSNAFNKPQPPGGRSLVTSGSAVPTTPPPGVASGRFGTVGGSPSGSRPLPSAVKGPTSSASGGLQKLHVRNENASASTPSITTTPPLQAGVVASASTGSVRGPTSIRGTFPKVPPPTAPEHSSPSPLRSSPSLPSAKAHPSTPGKAPPAATNAQSSPAQAGLEAPKHSNSNSGKYRTIHGLSDQAAADLQNMIRTSDHQKRGVTASTSQPSNRLSVKTTPFGGSAPGTPPPEGSLVRTLLDADFERRLEEHIEKRKDLEKRIDNERTVRLQMLASLKNIEYELEDKLSWMNPGAGGEKKGAMASVRGLFRKERKPVRSSFYSMQTMPVRSGSTSEDFPSTATPNLPIARKVFGVPLAKMLEGGHYIPKIVKEAIDYLKKNALKEKDLFVKEPNSAELLHLADAIETTGNPDFTDKDPHLVAAILKEFFDKLPDPLITSNIYDDLCLVQDLAHQSLRASMLHSLIFSMPTEHVMLLRALMAFLQQLTANININSLSPVSLGRVFGPLLVKRAESNSPTVNDNDTPRMVVQTLIREYSRIFIGDEKELKYVMKNNQQLVEAGTKEKLIEKLLDEYYSDKNFVDAFLLAHRYFVPSAELMDRLGRLFMSEYPTVSRKNVWDMRLQKRILEIIKRLVETQSRDLAAQRDFVSVLNKFLTSARTRAINHEPLYSTLVSWVKHAMQKPDEELPYKPELFYSPGPTRPWNPELGILQYSPSEVAQQMTIVDSSMFKLIPPKEFLFKAFTKPEASPKFTRMVERFNIWGNWVSAEIVKRKDIEKRLEVTCYFIKVAAECLSYQNFNACCAILGGLNSFAVNRLKLTWEKMPRKEVKTLGKMQALFSMEKNYKTYRDKLKDSKPPFVPYLALYSKDLFGLEENTENETATGLVNFAKLRKLYNTITSIQNYQNSMYNLKINTVIQEYLNNLKTVPDSELSTYSQECEARK